MGIDTLKQEEEGEKSNDMINYTEIGDNELEHFFDTLSSAKRFQYTLDYFDTSIGVLYSQENPSSINFCVALLREILCNLKPSHELWDKIKYAAFLLNLATRDVQFDVLYDIYHQVEIEVDVNNLTWQDFEVKTSFERKITEKLLIKEDVCSLPDLDERKTEKEYVFAEILGDVNDLNETEDFVIEDNKLESIEKAGVKVEESRKIRKTPTKRKPRVLEKTELKKPKLTKRPRKKPIVEEDPDFDSKGVEEAKFPCLQCNKFKARKQHELDKHSFEKHASNRLCTQCGHMSSTYKDFVAHNETHLFNCDICGKKVLGVRALRAHMKKHDLKKEDCAGVATSKVACDICGILLLPASVKGHMELAHSVEIHRCDLCGHTTNCKAKLLDHRNRHFEKLSTCPECGKMVKNIKRHFRRTCSGKKIRDILLSFV